MPSNAYAIWYHGRALDEDVATGKLRASVDIFVLRFFLQSQSLESFGMSAFDLALGDEVGRDSDLPLLYNLVYCSRAAAKMDESVIASIIEVARGNNARQDITGLLVFGGGIFFQWLEGPRDNVIRLMSTIAKDARHDTIVSFIENEEVRERVFPAWDMELVTPTDIREVLTDVLDTVKDEENVSALRRLLEQLDSGQLRNVGA